MGSRYVPAATIVIISVGTAAEIPIGTHTAATAGTNRLIIAGATGKKVCSR